MGKGRINLKAAKKAKRSPSAKRKSKKNEASGSRQYEMAGIAIFVVGIFWCISLMGQDMGALGDLMADTAHFLFGMTAIIPGAFLLYLGGWYIYKGEGFSMTKKKWLVLLLYLFVMGWIHHFYVPMGREMDADGILTCGGILGGAFIWGLHILCGSIGTTIVLAALTGLAVLVLTHWSLSSGVQRIGEKAGTQARRAQHVLTERKTEWQERRRIEREEAAAADNAPRDFLYKKKEMQEKIPAEIPAVTEEIAEAAEEPVFAEEPEEIPFSEEESEEILPEPEQETEIESESTPEEPESVPEESSGPAVLPAPEPAAIEEEKADASEYHFPPLTLLHGGKAAAGSLLQSAREQSAILEATLRSFGVEARITDVSVGPTVTRYELEPATGVKVSRITNLQNDIALQLAATHIRIEAPIPGKSAVGIEVPNAKVSEVPLRDVLESDIFKNKKGGVPVALGKDITGKTVVMDLAKMPHLLIAGSTGSGKSVCINTIIASILYHALPEEVKLILIDPKVVELSVYNGIPHLFIPVVTDSRKAAGALQWAVKEMEERYKKFAGSQVREIGGYNRAHPEEPMPFIVIVIDELADLLMTSKDSVVSAICRLAQKARAAGIHLVLATQRPSKEVLSGVIKANVPSRIAFAVSSQIDSRVILDMGGAEELIGKGDMLYSPIGSPNPTRVQGAFISDEEVESVVEYIKAERAEVPVEYAKIDLTAEEKPEAVEEKEEADELLRDAAEWMLDRKNERKASVSGLQRRFGIGYTRAGRLMDSLEQMGIVGPSEGAKPREVLMTWEQAEEKFFGGNA